ncbi:hypothetical protein HPP92_001997 [Vanilla planifolia]|uniref:Uncharacterized protein n=1 Tax=Vanilla planifolia TaxID=51239 RepID=A0A835VI26_VANPL|nr:hypothetical protein HPP92_001997 [Vanilla planifolia]
MRVKVYVIYVAAPDVDVGGQRRLRDQWILSEVYIDDDALEGHYVYGFVSLTIQPRRNTSRYTVRGYGQIYYSESEFDRFEFMLSGSPPPLARSFSGPLQARGSSSILVVSLTNSTWLSTAAPTLNIERCGPQWDTVFFSDHWTKKRKRGRRRLAISVFSSV